jgi:hypothetical protein
LDEAALLSLGHETGPAVRASEAEICRVSAEYINFAQHFAGRRHNHYGAFPVSCDVQIAVDIAPHSVHAMIRKLDEKTFACE